MYLRPGVVLDATWIDEVARFVEQAELRGIIDAAAATFRRAAAPAVARPLLVEAWRRCGKPWRPDRARAGARHLQAAL